MVAAVVGGGHGGEASVVMMVRLVAVAWRGDGDAAVVGGGVEMEMEMMVVVVRESEDISRNNIPRIKFNKWEELARGLMR
ncbi:hypothetical protein Tco_1078097 [Tanacetum coccineum]